MATVIKYSDYSPPDGSNVVIGDQVVRIVPGVTRALALNAQVLALGSPEYVEELSRKGGQISGVILRHTDPAPAGT